MKYRITRSFSLPFIIVLLIFSLISGILFAILMDQYRTESYLHDLRDNAKNTAYYISHSMKQDAIQNIDGGHNIKNQRDNPALHVLSGIINGEIWLVDTDALTMIIFNIRDRYVDVSHLQTGHKAMVESVLNGQTISDRENKSMFRTLNIIVGVPVYEFDDDNNIIAALFMFSNIRDYGTDLSFIIGILFVSLSIALLLALGTSFVLASKMASPLRIIENVTQQLTTGNYQVRSPIIRNDEIGSLSNHINSLANNLHQTSLENARLNQVQKELIVNIAHDLRTPVSIICSSAEAICDGVVSDQEKIRQYHQKMLNASARMQRMIEDLFDLSCLQDADYKIKKEMINLTDVVDDTVDTATSLALSKNILVEYSKGFNKQDFCGDYDRLYQMIVAVLDNALKFSSNGQKVEIKFVKNADEAILEITNYGKCIKPEHLPHLFERFHKTNEQGGGTGLGLPIAKQIADRHGIKIKVSSKEKCTVFSFFFPIN